MMTSDELLRCIKKINPSAHVAIWQDDADSEPYPKYDAAHIGHKPSKKECEAVLDDVRDEIAKERGTEEARQKLIDIDLKSIRAIREWIAKQDNAPQDINDYETQAVAERAKLK